MHHFERASPEPQYNLRLIVLLQLLLLERSHHWHLFEQFNIGIIKGIRSVCPPISQFFTVHFTDTFLPTADPDRSNPTRSRWERPLDTIRSFEAAIDGNYSRKSYMRTGQPSLSFNVDNTLSIAIMLTYFLYRISGFVFTIQSSK